ncbi:MAG: T9SS type A sorting domain-containing protein [Ferruginibacter sp.]
MGQQTIKKAKGKSGDTNQAGGTTTQTTTELSRSGATLTPFLYPNPLAGNVLYIANLENKPAKYRIFNTVGRELGSGIIEERGIDVSVLKAGVYLLEVVDGTATTTLRFIKKKFIFVDFHNIVDVN